MRSERAMHDETRVDAKAGIGAVLDAPTNVPLRKAIEEAADAHEAWKAAELEAAVAHRFFEEADNRRTEARHAFVMADQRMRALVYGPDNLEGL